MTASDFARRLAEVVAARATPSDPIVDRPCNMCGAPSRLLRSWVPLCPGHFDAYTRALDDQERHRLRSQAFVALMGLIESHGHGGMFDVAEASPGEFQVVDACGGVICEVSRRDIAEALAVVFNHHEAQS